MLDLHLASAIEIRHVAAGGEPEGVPIADLLRSGVFGNKGSRRGPRILGWGFGI